MTYNILHDSFHIVNDLVIHDHYQGIFTNLYSILKAFLSNYLEFKRVVKYIIGCVKHVVAQEAKYIVGTC